MNKFIVERVELLEQFATLFDEMGFATNIVSPSEDVPFHSLIVRFTGMGEADFLDFQLAFLPNTTQQPEAENPLILQTFVELYPHVLPAHMAELRWLTMKLNLSLPVGFFGVYEEAQLLYFKHNSFVDKRVDWAIHAEWLDKQTGAILHLFSLFLVPLLQVAQGELSAQEVAQALEQGHLQ